MKSQTIITLVTAGFLGAAWPLAAQHPAGGEHPTNASDRPAGAPNPSSASKPNAAAKQASTADISTGIKSHVAATSKNSPDGKFHFKHEGKDLALTLSKVHDLPVST